MDSHQEALLLQAAAEAVGDFKAGQLVLSVPDVQHLEKRWDKLPGASSGAVAVQDAKSLLGTEVLAGEALEYVVREFLATLDQAAPADTLTRREFVRLAHVAEVAQSKAFDLVTAEDAAVPRSEPGGASHKKRPPPIRDAHIDTWRIAAAPAFGDSAEEGYDAAQAEAGPLEAGAAGVGLSRATSLVPGAGPLEAGAAALSPQQASGGSSPGAELEEVKQRVEEGVEEVEVADEAADEAAELAPSLPVDAEVAEFQAKLNGLMERVSSDVARHTAADAAPHGDNSASGVQGEAPTRGSWESFGSGGSGRSAGAALGQTSGVAATPPVQQQAQLNEAVISAAMAAGMTFMQHLQAAGGMANAQVTADMNPLRHAAAVAAAAVAASPSLAGSHTAGSVRSVGPGSPDVLPPRGGGAAGAPQHLIAEMMAHLRLDGATAEQLEAAAASLHQQALAMHQQQHGGARPTTSAAGSAGSVASGEAASSHNGEAPRRNWRAFDEDNQAGQHRGGSQPQPQRSELSGSPHKMSRFGPAAAAAAAPQASQVSYDSGEMPPPAPRLRPPAADGLCGSWTPMPGDDVRRCQGIFKKKGYAAVGGMEKHYAMEYFAKLQMAPHIFHAAWSAADQGADNRLDWREFCVFVQLLRGAQKGLPLPTRLSREEAAGLLGEGPMPPPPAAPQQMHIDAAHMRSVLGGGHSRQGSFVERAESVIQGFDGDDSDGASSADSGIAESVISTSSRRGPHQAHSFALGGARAPPPPRSRLGSVLGRFAGPAAFHGGLPQPAAGVGYPGAVAGADQVAHSVLEVAVRGAEIKYRKPLSTPIFTLSVRDSLGRLVELPTDTHPGHYRRETQTIHSAAIVRFNTTLRSMPPGTCVYVEIKHWKADKKRFSTLAWAYVPLDRLVDFGPATAMVRSGIIDLPLFKKPVDLSHRKTRRLSRALDLHLTLRGIE